MYAYLSTAPQIERTAYEAFDIAWSFLDASEDLGDVTIAQAFIASVIMGLLQGGERHKIRLANLAISAFQRTPATERGHTLAGAGTTNRCGSSPQSVAPPRTSRRASDERSLDWMTDFRSMATFDPATPCKVHDQLNDCVFDWKPEWADNYREHATSGFAKSIVAWDGLLLDGWAHNRPALVK